MNAFAGHDGVIYEDAEHDDEAVQGEEINGHAEVGHHGKRAHERDRHAEAYPEGHARAQEQAEQHDDAADADEGGVVEGDEAFLDDVGAVVPNINVHALRQLGFQVGQIILNSLFDLEGILRTGAGDVHDRAAFAVEPHDHTVFLEAIADGGDFAERQMRAVFAGFDDDLVKRRLIKGSAFGAY